MISLSDYIDKFVFESEKKDKERAELRSKIMFDIYNDAGEHVNELGGNNLYKKIVCKFYDKEKGIKISFLLGMKDNSWQLWYAKPGVVSYDDDPQKDLKETEFLKALNKAIDECEKVINDISENPEDYPQYFTDF